MIAVGLSCIKYSLGPILWLQGQQVRKRTSMLPEPIGDRNGQVGSGQPLHLLILGDSSAAGVGVEMQQDALLGHILQNLRTDYQISYQLQAKTGAKTSDVLTNLQQAIHHKWMDSPKLDVILTALGVNDVTAQVSLKKWRKQQQLLIETIHKNLQPKLLIISGLPPVHLFPALPLPLRPYLGAWATLFNTQLQQLAADYSQTRFLGVRDLPQPVDVATDGFHPGPATYQQWGQAVTNLIGSALNRSA